MTEKVAFKKYRCNWCPTEKLTRKAVWNHERCCKFNPQKKALRERARELDNTETTCPHPQAQKPAAPTAMDENCIQDNEVVAQALIELNRPRILGKRPRTKGNRVPDLNEHQWDKVKKVVVQHVMRNKAISINELIKLSVFDGLSKTDLNTHIMHQVRHLREAFQRQSKKNDIIKSLQERLKAVTIAQQNDISPVEAAAVHNDHLQRVEPAFIHIQDLKRQLDQQVKDSTSEIDKQDHDMLAMQAKVDRVVSLRRAYSDESKKLKARVEQLKARNQELQEKLDMCDVEGFRHIQSELIAAGDQMKEMNSRFNALQNDYANLERMKALFERNHKRWLMFEECPRIEADLKHLTHQLLTLRNDPSVSWSSNSTW